MAIKTQVTRGGVPVQLTRDEELKRLHDGVNELDTAIEETIEELKLMRQMSAEMHKMIKKMMSGVCQ